MRVYVFEDDDYLRGSLARALAGEGYAVVSCATAEPWCATVQEGDVVVANGLRDAMGRTIPEALAAARCVTPCVQISADPDLRRHALSTALLRKPFERSALLAAVADAAGWAQRVAAALA